MNEQEKAITRAESILNGFYGSQASEDLVLAEQYLQALERIAFLEDRLSRLEYPDTTGQ